MTAFEDLYSETETTGTLWIGRGETERIGEIIASSAHADQHGRLTYYGSFHYDGETGVLRMGDIQLGLPGKIILGRISDSVQAILLDGQGGKITLGGHQAGNGAITLLDRFGAVAGVFDGEDATITMGGTTNPGRLFVRSIKVDQHGTKMPWGSLVYDGDTAVLQLGSVVFGKPGKIVIGASSGEGDQAILLDGSGGHVTLGGEHCGNGSLTVRNLAGTPVGVLDAEHATLTLGHEAAAGVREQDTDGVIYLRNAGGDDTVVLDGKNGNITLGGGAADGDLTLRNAVGDDTVVLDGENGNITLGGGGTADGDLTVLSAGGKTSISLAGSDAAITVGGAGGMNGDIVVKNGDDVETITMKGSDGTITLGGEGVNGDIFIKNDNDIETIKIFGSIGDIEFLNADLAEEFEIDRPELAAPGTVMVLTDEGTLTPCAGAYDGRVVGVVAGAGEHRPGIVMDKRGGDSRVPIALVGKAFCLADASAAPIAVGDLLTTSSHAGHAMKAADRLLAMGSVIGKALAPLPTDRGLIPMLVMAR